MPFYFYDTDGDLIRQELVGAIPVGSISLTHLDPSTDSIPDGYLVCDGSEVLRNDFLDLFSIIGTTFGAGDGSTTFNLPSFTGSMIRGATSGAQVGATGGGKDHAHTLPSHAHAMNDQHRHDMPASFATHVHTQSHVHNVRSHGHGGSTYNLGASDDNENTANDPGTDQFSAPGTHDHDGTEVQGTTASSGGFDSGGPSSGSTSGPNSGATTGLTSYVTGATQGPSAPIVSSLESNMPPFLTLTMLIKY